jgi:pilus assembly protein CpaF
MCTLPLLAGENISARFVVPTVVASVDRVIRCGIDQHGVRRVNEIVGVPGRVENDVIETESLFERGLSPDLRVRAVMLLTTGVCWGTTRRRSSTFW